MHFLNDESDPILSSHFLAGFRYSVNSWGLHREWGFVHTRLPNWPNAINSLLWSGESSFPCTLTKGDWLFSKGTACNKTIKLIMSLRILVAPNKEKNNFHQGHGLYSRLQPEWRICRGSSWSHETELIKGKGQTGFLKLCWRTEILCEEKTTLEF